MYSNIYISIISVPLALFGASPLHDLFSRESPDIKKRGAGVYPHSQAMLIFLDDYETDIGAVTMNFAAALYQPLLQKIIPQYVILASKSLLQNIAAYKKLGKTLYDTAYNAMISRSQDLFHARDDFYGSYKIPLPTANILIIEAIITMGWIQQFDYSDAWDTYAIRENMLLFIPKSGPQAVLGLHTSPSTLLNSKFLMQEIISESKDNDPSKFLQSTVSKRPKSANYVLEALPSLFMVNGSYADISTAPQWVIYINGHGQAGTILASVSLNEFKKILDFFNRSITTRCLIISSCYATGINVDKVYGNSNKKYFSTTYPFPIILEGVADVALTGGIIGKVSFKGTLPEISLLRNYITFGTLAKDIQPIPYKELLSCIFPSDTGSITEALTRASNFAQIRLANRHEFKPVFAAIEITKIMANARSSPLNIAKTWQALRDFPVRSKTPYVLLSAKDIPFILDCSDLAVQSNDPLCFISSMLPGNADHSLAGLAMPKGLHPLAEIPQSIEKMFSQRKLGSRKRFLIDKVQVLDTSSKKHSSNIYKLFNCN